MEEGGAMSKHKFHAVQRSGWSEKMFLFLLSVMSWAIAAKHKTSSAEIKKLSDKEAISKYAKISKDGHIYFNNSDLSRKL